MNITFPIKAKDITPMQPDPRLFRKICNGAYSRIKSQPETTFDLLTTINAKVDKLSRSSCDFNRDMIQFPQRASPSATLENCTGFVQIAVNPKGDDGMIKRLRVCIGYHEDGTPIITQKSGHTELELSDNIAKALLASARRSEFVPEQVPAQSPQPTVDVPTLREYAEMWLNTYKVGKLKPTTLKGYRVMLNAQLYPAWGDTPLNQITTKAIQDFWDERKEKSRKYLRDLKNFLSQILESARLDKIITDNPCKDTRLENPSDKVNVRQAVPEASVKDIIAGLHLLDDDPKAQKYMALVIFTGARKGEILGLRYEDIDEDLIHIRRNVTFTSNQPIVGTPKTQAGYRDVPILNGLREFIGSGDPSSYIVTGTAKPLTQSAHARMMQRVKAKIDLNGATSHNFRHSMGTLLHDTGADVKTIQAILGQTDYKTTADRYVHSVMSTEMQAAAKVNDRLCAANA